MSGFDLVARALGFERVKDLAAPGSVDTPYTWPVWRENTTWTETTLAGYAAAGYSGNALVYSCIARKAESAAFAPLVAYTGERDEPERLPDVEPLAALLLRPNVYQSWYEFMELLITYLELDGNAFIMLAPESVRSLTIASMWPLRPDRMRPVPKAGQLIGYVYEPENNLPETFLPEEIIHVKYPNPVDPFDGLGRGTSPLAAAAQATDVDNAATSFLKSFFDNAVVPFGLLKTKQTLLDPEVKRIRERLRSQYGGARQWGDVMILDADAEYQRLGLTMDELSFDVLDARNEARICQVLKVPPIIAGAKIGLDRCMPADTRVWTPTGAERIGDIRPGRVVWSFVDGNIEPRRVTNWALTGHRKVLEIRTKNRTVQATDNHPFLVRVPGLMTHGNNAERAASWTWKRADQLCVGDRIVQVKSLPDQGGDILPDGTPATKGWMKFLGVIIGDGTVSPGVGVRIAMPPEDRCCKAYRDLATQLFTKQVSQSGGGLDVQATVERVGINIQKRERDFGFSSARDSRWLAELGFGGRAKTKRIPVWVYGLRRDLRLAFLAGLVDSDGSIDKRGALAFAFCSESLTHDVRELLISVGIQCSNVYYCQIGSASLPNRGNLEVYDSWRFTASSARQVAQIPFTDHVYRQRVEANLHREKADGFDADKAGLAAELGFYKIKSIEALPEVDVYDIEVEGGHSFVANGIVVSNSTFANYGEARSSFWEDSLIPGVYKRFEDAFSGGLTPHFPGQWVAFDYSDVPALREDATAKWETAVRAFLGGVATRNEARALAGLEPVEDARDGFRATEQQQIGAPGITQRPPEVEGAASEDVAAELEDEEDEGKGWQRKQELVAAHHGIKQDLTCPLCKRVGVEVFADHGGLCVCTHCQRTFDPALELVQL